MQRSSYHHGQLPEALLDAAAKLVEESGLAELSLRAVARRAGVSHGAPAHHFGDKAGLLTALAAQGFRLFRDALEHARQAAGDDVRARFAATGHAYVMFAVSHRAHFEIMFRPELLRGNDPQLHEASLGAYGVLLDTVTACQQAGVLAGRDPAILAASAWSQAHGLATLWLTGNLQPSPQYPDLESLARAVFSLSSLV